MDDEIQTLGEEIAGMFGELAAAECGGWDPWTSACLAEHERRGEYEAERRAEMERNAAYAAKRREQLARANATRRTKRKGLHLSNAERARYADLTSAGVMTTEEVARETGCSVSTAERLGQFVLEGVA